ncbi:GNAT family N-acetyltransferase [Actinokineospora sp. NBRC 105648]|uniref:GNAT family N-acetyltransferase n=1 Tax=Actinokineospora sp. NBRC 105648 TaxID=3032206 RepID=UPI00249FA4F4|nr:GNAT family N-acetyltransferase [Actinokineospora sp. NBRC 105648]GLZ37290.1 UPF0256 protein [Actinokineospora sp. NBRC 105648]
MSDVEIRTLTEPDLRTAIDLFRVALHAPTVPDEQWEHARHSFEPGRTLGAFAGDRMVGTALAYTSSLVVPGGRVLPMAAVTRVGVRADFRRRGVLRELMRAQLADVAARGEVFAGLRATEPVIYGRFGYGVANLAVKRVLLPRGARVRPEVPAGGEVRFLEPAAARELLPRLYARVGQSRAGTMARPPQWWCSVYDRPFAMGEFLLVAAHFGADGPDGFVAYRPKAADQPGKGAALSVEDFVAPTPEVASALWRFLLGVDLVEELTVWTRPADEPVEAMLEDSRAVRDHRVVPDLWTRIVDVPAALAGRDYGAGSVVVEVVDEGIPANSGRYRVGADGVERTAAAAELSVDVEVLSMLYMGASQPSALAGIGRVRELAEGAAQRADAVFAVPEAAWCGTFF